MAATTVRRSPVAQLDGKGEKDRQSVEVEKKRAESETGNIGRERGDTGGGCTQGA